MTVQYYFDNAATTLPKPPEVGLAVLHAINTFGGAGRSSHEAALAASRCIFQTRVAVAKLLGSAPERTVFTSNGTESLNIAIQGLFSEKDHIITTVLEHNSVLRPLYRLKSQGMGMSIVGADSAGQLDYGAFARSLRPNTKAVVVTHASNLTGTLTDLSFLSKFCAENGLLFLVDAAQTAGVFPISADQMGIDVLCFTGHKGLYGPQGTGGLCVGKNIRINPLKTGGSGFHSDEKEHPSALPDSLEAGTLNAHGLAGLLAGVQFISQTGINGIAQKEAALTKRFLLGLSSLPMIRILGENSLPRTATVSLNIGSLDSALVADRLSTTYGMAVRSGAHCAPLAHQLFGTAKQGAVRFSFSYFNTNSEVDAAIQAISEIAGQL